MEKLAINGGTPYKTKSFPEWPIFDENEVCYLNEVLNSRNWWRVTGTKVKQFESEFAAMQGMPYGIGVTNGTSALQLALMTLGIGKGDEVIVPGMTFISTGLAVLECGAYPVLVDIDKDTYCMNPDAFENAITDRTKAVIPVHMAGNACNMDKICEIANKRGLMIIEDSAHANGAEYNGKRLGSFGDASIFSFQNGKLMTCGEGGALLLKDQESYNLATVIQDVGRPKDDKIYEHVVMGANFRMDEFHAAILLAQMKRVDKMNQIREKNAKYLDELIKDIEGIKPQIRTENCNIFSHYMYMFEYDKKYFNNCDRLKFVQALNAEGIPANVCFPVMSETQFFKENNFRGNIDSYSQRIGNSLDNSKRIADNAIWIHHRTLEGDNQDIEEIAGAINKIKKCIYLIS